jgi:hypothetical protein
VHPRTRAFFTGRLKPKSAYPIFDPMVEKTEKQLYVTTEKDPTKRFVFKVYYANGSRFSRWQNGMPSLTSNRGVMSIHLSSLFRWKELRKIGETERKQITDTTKAIMEKHRVTEKRTNVTPFWGYEGTGKVQTYLMVPATDKTDASTKMKGFVDELRAELAAKVDYHLLYLILPAYTETGGSMNWPINLSNNAFTGYSD